DGDGDIEAMITVGAGGVVSGGFYTAAAIGFDAPIPEVCPDSTMPGNFDQPCPPALGARMALFEDDGTVDAAAAKLRVLHAIPNAPAVDVCYDDDPEDETPPVAIASNVAFGEASDYFESDTAITSGVVTVHQAVEGMTCVAAAQLGTPLPIPAAFEAVRDGFEAASGGMGGGANIATTFELGTIRTIF